MADYTANAKGLDRSRRAKKTDLGDGANKGQTLRRYEVVSDTQIKGGEIFVLSSVGVAADDTFTITVVAT